MESLDSDQLEEFIKAFEEMHAEALEDPRNPTKLGNPPANTVEMDGDFVSEYFESLESSAGEEEDG